MAISAPGSVIRVATRASELARWQADHVADLLRGSQPGLSVEVVPVSTEGDRRTDVPLSQIGGKGVFAKEVQLAVLDGRADIAVHSAKDLPAATPPGLRLVAVPTRGEVRDALVGAGLDELRAAVRDGRSPVVATGSARRRVQLAEMVPGLSFAELRGNMATRLDKAAGFDAIVVATVALERLGLATRITEVIPADQMVPQVGQGALGIECRSDDDATITCLEGIEDPRSRTDVDAERAFLSELGGDCSLPAGAHCRSAADGTLRLSGILAAEVPATGVVHAGGTPGGLMKADATGVDPDSLGRLVARDLLARVNGS